LLGEGIKREAVALALGIVQCGTNVKIELFVLKTTNPRVSNEKVTLDSSRILRWAQSKEESASFGSNETDAFN